MTRESYLENTVSTVPRLLTNMDRKEGSSTYGCLCRPYWHDKTMDFPSAHQQMGVLPLAVAYKTQSDKNTFYKSEEVMEACKAGMLYWSRIQRKNGSFDEHYPYENSLGATAWSLWAISRAYLVIENPPEIEEEIDKAVRFLLQYDEPGTLANHQAVTASALFFSSKIVDIDKSHIEDRIQNVKNLQDEEGWFREYRGADPGYHTTTISHLAQIWREDRSLVDENMLEDALCYFSSFIDKQNYYGKEIGSRHTSHIHPLGFEILASEFRTAEKIAYCIRNNLAENNLLTPDVMDDKHFSRLQAEFVLSYSISNDLKKTSKTLEEKNRGDIIVKEVRDNYIVLNKKRGGIYKIYRSGQLVNQDNGILASINGDYYTSNWYGTTERVTEKDNKIIIEGKLRKIPDNRLFSYKYILFHVFQYVTGRFPRISLRLKQELIEKLIQGENSGYGFRRVIDLEKLTHEDEADGTLLEHDPKSEFVPSTEFYNLN